MNIRTIFIILVAIAVGIWDACISSWLPAPLNAIRFILPLTVILSAFSTSRARVMIAAVIAGVTFGLLAPSNAGFVFFRMVCVALVVMFLAARILTNRTLVSAAAIGGIAVVLDRVLLMGFEWLIASTGHAVYYEDRASLIASAIWVAFLMMSFFVLSAAFSRRFLPILSRVDRTSRIPLWKS